MVPEDFHEPIVEQKPTRTPGATREPPAAPTAVPTTEAANEPAIISAADSRIRYSGRFDFSDPDQVYFDWSAVTIEAGFTGPSLTLLLEDSANFYDVWIDGQKQILEGVPGKLSYPVAQDLADEIHSVRIVKRTEAYVGGGTFSGFILDAGHDLLGRPGAPRRRIEFIGDSITTGYGNEGESPTCWFTAATQNATRTYAAITAAHFDADYTIVALSGLGVVRDLRAAEADSAETAIDFVDRAVAMNPALVWDSDHEQPDAVVVNLGTNDFSSLPFPDKDFFVESYVDLLLRIRERYPLSVIFALSGPLMLGPAPAAIRTAVELIRLNNNDEKVHYVFIEDNLDQSGADFGCDWHPNVKGHQKIAAQLIPELADGLGWNGTE